MFNWRWELNDIKQDKDITVFSTFSCGEGSSLGYKKAGFRVIGNVEIDPQINQMYIRNNHPIYNYQLDLRDFNNLDNLPDELYHLNILDGSPPCTPFSAAGIKEKGWGKKKQFREGQTFQTLDDLFFVFLDTVEKLRPEIVVAENVTGMLDKKSKFHIKMIQDRFKSLGYEMQLFNLNSALMDVPQIRRRLFFIANRKNYKKLVLNFAEKPILFGSVRSEHGKEITMPYIKYLLRSARPGDGDLREVAQRITGEKNRYFNSKILHDENIAPTIVSGGYFIRFFDKTYLSDADYCSVQTFPQDYDFGGNDVQYVCGMSVPPNMMAHIATEIYKQWLS